MSVSETRNVTLNHADSAIAAPPLTAHSNAFPHPDAFVRRHIGPHPEEAAAMLKLLGYSSLGAMMDAAVPKAIRLAKPLQLPAARGEYEALAALKAIASQNQVFRSFIGRVTTTASRPP